MPSFVFLFYPLQHKLLPSNGGEQGQEENLFHCFPAKFHSLHENFQTISANGSLGCIPSLLSSFSDLLEHCLSPPAIRIMPCFITDWHVNAALSPSCISRGLGLYFKVFLYLPLCLPWSPYLNSKWITLTLPTWNTSYLFCLISGPHQNLV